MTDPIKYLCKQDAIFQQIINLYGQPVIPYRPPTFATLVLFILEQQVSIDSAKAHYEKLKTFVPGIEPQYLIELPDTDFRLAGISRQKTSYLKGLSAAIIDKTLKLEDLVTMSPKNVYEKLIKIKGIGRWTIDVYLMFSLKAPDILPLGDIAVINCIKELLQITDKKEMEIYTQKWAPHRTMATYLLWHYYLKKRNRTVTY